MNVFTLNEAFQYVDDKYLDIVEQERVRKARRRTGNRQGLIAACIIGLILILGLPAAAIAANWFGLRDLIIPRTPYSSGIETSPSEGRNADADVSPEGDGDVCIIGLSGYQGSAEAQALAEWQAFLADYDSDHAILEKIGNGPTGVDSRYDLYYVYTQDMADKLEEIVQKYHLKLHSQINDVRSEELEHLVGGKFLPHRYGKYGGYIYEDGSFRFEGGIFWDDGVKVAYQFARTVKGTFDEVILNIGNVQDFQEFSYVTAGGETVMIAMGEDVSLICLDAESCFICMNLINWYDSKITKEHLMEVAETIDFALLKNVRIPEMREDSAPYGQVESGAGTEETTAYSEEELLDPGEKRITAKEDYREILLGNEDFINIDIVGQNRKLNLGNIKKVASDEDWIEARATKFAIIDLNRDGEMELVLWIQVNENPDYGFEILYPCNGEIYGFTLGYRQFLELKTDGSFVVSAGVENTNVYRLQLSETGYEVAVLSDDDGSQKDKKDAEWYDLTEDSIARFLQ